MKSKSKHSIFFKGIVFALAFALSVLCFPMEALLTFADVGPSQLNNYHVLTIEGGDNNTLKDGITTGEECDIPDAYIGSKPTGEDTGWKIGNKENNNKQLSDDGATLKSSKVEVTYVDGTVITSSDDTGVAVGDETVRPKYDGTFKAEHQGVYTITYSYTYEKDKKEVTYSYQMEVISSLAMASINFNHPNVSLVSSSDHNSVIDFSLTGAKKDGGAFKEIDILLPEVLDEDGEKVDDVKFFANSTPTASAESPKQIVVISAYGGAKGQAVRVKESEGNFYIDTNDMELNAEEGTPAKTIANSVYGDSTYTLKFDYYVLSSNSKENKYRFVTSNTKAFEVFGTSEDGSNTYYKNKKYALEVALESDWSDNGETGVEKTIPKPKGQTKSDSEPANEQVDVSYSVKVGYKERFSDATWTDLKEIKKDGTTELLYADQLNEDGTLKDSTKFKPLQDGFYSFVYTVTDFYGNHASNGASAFMYTGDDDTYGITDKTKPTPIIYDASQAPENYEDIKDEEYKSKSYTSSNAIVVYAIGMTDNHSDHDDEGVVMSRKVRKVGAQDLFTIEDKDYAKYNLIFNYRATESNGETTIEAFRNLINNDFNLRKQFTFKAQENGLPDIPVDAEQHEIKTNADMLGWLVKHGYRIVIDNANSTTIFKLFENELKASNTALATADAEAFKTFLTKERTSDAEKAELEAYKKKLVELGFAYVNVDKTFGQDGDDGFGRGTFQIQYYVKDAAGNEASKEVQMTIVASLVDEEGPEITFKSTLKTNYLPTDVVTFDAPTSTDSYDSYLYERTLYRYLDEDGTPVALYKDDNAEVKTQRETVDLTELKNDLTGKYDSGILATEKYKEYFETTSGYFEITDASATTYEIDLNELELAVNKDKPAVELQVVTFVYDDSGNASMFAQSTSITNVIDKFAPMLNEAPEDDEETHYQGEEIKLNKIVFADDAVENMGYEVKVTTTQKGTTMNVPVSGSYQERNGHFYTLYPGSFNASFAGKYDVLIKVSDGNENSIIYFQSYDVKQRFAVQPPTIDQTTLPESQTIELEGDDNYNPAKGIEIPTPKVSYEIPNSLTWDEYKGNETTYDSSSDYQYVVWGVKENGAATAYSVTQGKSGTFIPKDVGTYEFKYQVNIRIFDFHQFELQEEEYDGVTPLEGDTLLFKNGTGLAKGATVKFLGNNTFEVKDAATVNTYKLVIDNTEMKVYDDVENLESPKNDLSQTMFNDKAVYEAFRSLRNYVLESNTYTINVVDTKAPELIPYSYADALDPNQLAKEGNKVTVYGIETVLNKKSGINDIDVANCSITVSYTLASGLPSGGDVTYKAEKAFQDQVYEFPTVDGKVSDGTYKITYKVADVRGHETTKVFEFTVGDTKAPKMTFPDNFVESTYEIGKVQTLTIDLNKITFKDDVTDALPEGTFTYKPTATLRNTSTGETIDPTEDSEGLVYYFPLDNVGQYTLTIEVQDAVGNTARQTFNFEVVSRTADTTMTYQVIGTVLIVISVLVLAGVIIYFIVSKVKLDKELKK